MNPKKKPFGRPKSDNPADQRLPHIRVTKDQITKYKVQAEQKQLTLSAWVKQTLDKACKRNK